MLGQKGGVCVAWRTKPSSPNHVALCSANMSSENFFAAQYLGFWRLSIQKLKIRSLKEKIIECDWNCYSIPLYFFIYFCSKSGNRFTLFPSWNMNNFMNEMSWNSQISWFISLKQAEPLHRLCSVLFQVDWKLKTLCRRERCGLAGGLMLSLKAFSSTAWPWMCTRLWVCK